MQLTQLNPHTMMVKSFSEIPVKFASREIAATEEFRNKWLGHDLAIVISDIWHGSGEPQKVLASAFHLMAAVPLQADALMMLQASPASIECARYYLENSKNSCVVYDDTNTFDAMYPAGSFECPQPYRPNRNTKSLFCGDKLIYKGPYELIPQIVRDAYEHTKIHTYDSMLCQLHSDVSKAFATYFGKGYQKLSPLSAKKYIEVMSCDTIHIPSKIELGIENKEHDEDPIFNELCNTFSSILWRIVLPVSEPVQQYISAIEQAYDFSETLNKIWNNALKCTPFELVRDTEDVEEFINNMDPKIVKTIAEMLGVTSAIDAIVSGVPIEDVLA